MTAQEQIAGFLDRHVSLPRSPVAYGNFPHPPLSWYYRWTEPRPTVEQLAQQFLEIAEFRTLQLGNWLGTTDGAIIAAAVEMVMPPFFQEDVELLVAALKLAADMQHVVGRETAARLAFGFAGVVVLVALVSTSGRPNTG